MIPMTTMLPAQELRDVIRVEIPPAAVAVAAVEIQIAAERLLWSILIIRMQVINRLYPICS